MTRRTASTAVVAPLALAVACGHAEPSDAAGSGIGPDDTAAPLDPYPDVESVEGCASLVPWPGDLAFRGPAGAEMQEFCESGYNGVSGSLSLLDVDSVAPLDCLCEVGGSLGLTSSAELDLAAFDDLRSVGGSLVLWLDGVGAIDGFPALLVVGGTLSVRGQALQDISGFRSLYAISDGLTLPSALDAPLLTDVSGLNELATVSFLEIDSTSLRHLSGLRSVETLTWAYAGLDIRDNAELRDIEGLTGPLAVPDSVDIVNNSKLASVQGLHGIQSIAGCLHIEDNPSLPFDDALALRDAIGSANIGCVQIEGNGEK